MRLIFLQLILLAILIPAFSQSHLLFGEWKSYLPYNVSYKISESGNKIFCNSDMSLYSIDKDDHSVEFYDRTNYLSDIEVLRHDFDPYNNQLLIVYKNGNIDILADDGIDNLSDVKSNINISYDKKISDICIANENFAYLAFDYGVSQINLKSHDFGFTCFTGFSLNSVIANNDILFIGTDNGIYRFDLSSKANPNDIGQWTKIYDKPCTTLINYKGNTLFYSGYNIMKINSVNDIETVFEIEDHNHEIKFIDTDDEFLYFGTFYDGNYSSYMYVTNLEDYTYSWGTCVSNPQDFHIDNNKNTWYTTIHNNISYSEGVDKPCDALAINSPHHFDCSNIFTSGNSIYIASGGSNRINYGPSANRNGFYYLRDGVWHSFYTDGYPFFRENNIENFLNITADEVNEKLYVSAYRYGLFEMDMNDETFIYYKEENSELKGTIGDEPGAIRISYMKFDDDNNLWMALYGAEFPLVVKKDDGTWVKFKLPQNYTYIGEFDFDHSGKLWVRVLNFGIMVYDTKNTLDDSSDDEYVILNEDNSSLETRNINFIKTDLDGNIWAGTDKGPIVFECPEQVMGGNCNGTKKKTVLNGIADYVLNDVNINCIEVDGANRKWIGTNSGVYILNANGDEEIDHFDFNNSPLFSNIITSMAYNGNSGEMIIGTEKGVLSFKTETTIGKQINDYDAYVYPNPVRPDFDGLIAIKGLARDANVKITDISGNLIYETKSQGGQATWDGKDFRGNKVGSGTYVAVSTSTNNSTEPEAITLKIFIIR